MRSKAGFVGKCHACSVAHKCLLVMQGVVQHQTRQHQRQRLRPCLRTLDLLSATPPRSATLAPHAAACKRCCKCAYNGRAAPFQKPRAAMTMSIAALINCQCATLSMAAACLRQQSGWVGLLASSRVHQWSKRCLPCGHGGAACCERWVCDQSVWHVSLRARCKVHWALDCSLSR